MIQTDSPVLEWNDAYDTWDTREQIVEVDVRVNDRLRDEKSHLSRGFEGF